MPKVGKKEFPYTAKGMAMAKAEAKKRGVKMSKGKMSSGAKHEKKESAKEQMREYGRIKQGKKK
jgi:hypothetical protein